MTRTHRTDGKQLQNTAGQNTTHLSTHYGPIFVLEKFSR